MILLWGIDSDGPLSSVRCALERIGARVAFLDQRTAPQCSIEIEACGAPGGTLATPDGDVQLRSVTAAYLRPYDFRRLAALQGIAADSDQVRRAFAFEDALTGWLEVASVRVVNRPSAMASNNSKPFQSELIRASGFDVPETLVTTDPSAAVEFWREHGDVIYKSVSGVRSIVTRLGPAHSDRLADIAHCPTQFQRYIQGNDVRVHVVGGEVFGCEIRSSADDYRYPGRQDAQVHVRALDVPDELAGRCRALAARLDLHFVGIDLRRTRDGCWYCFEANPSPGFTFYQEATGQPIDEAVAHLLSRRAT